MSVILNLPFDVSNIILCQWCNLKELIALDSSMCNHGLLPVLRHLFMHVSGIDVSGSRATLSIIWPLMRDISLSYLFLEDDRRYGISVEKLCTYPKLQKLETLHLRNLRENTVFAANLANVSVHLKSLLISQSGMFFSMLQPTVLARLNKLSIRDSNMLESNVLPIMEHCRTLHWLQICCVPFYEQYASIIPHFLSIVKHNPDLRVCEMSVGNREVLNAILLNCLNIEEIILGRFDMTLSDIRVILTDNPQLKKLELEYFIEYVNKGKGSEFKLQHYTNANNDLNSFLGSFTDLRKLKILEGVAFNEETMRLVLDRSALNLEILAIRRAINFQDDTILKEIVERCSKLIHFECFVIDGNDVKEIFSSPNILRLVRVYSGDEDLDGVTPMKLRDVKDVIDSCPFGSRFKFYEVDEPDEDDGDEYYDLDGFNAGGELSFADFKKFLYQFKANRREVKCSVLFGRGSDKVLNYRHGFFGGVNIEKLMTKDERNEWISQYMTDDEFDSVDGDRPSTPMSDFMEEQWGDIEDFDFDSPASSTPSTPRSDSPPLEEGDLSSDDEN